MREIEKDLKSRGGSLDAEHGQAPPSGKHKSRQFNRSSGYTHPYDGMQAPRGFNYAQPPQQQWHNPSSMQPRQLFQQTAMRRASQASPKAMKRNGRWPAWMNRCNDCNLESQWSSSSAYPMQLGTSPMINNGRN